MRPGKAMDGQNHACLGESPAPVYTQNGIVSEYLFFEELELTIQRR